MEDSGTPGVINYTDLLFGDEYNVPSIPPHYLVSVISMILRDPSVQRVKDIIQKDPLLQEVLFTDRNTYDKKLILVLVRILQQAYGFEFLGLGRFSKYNYITQEDHEKSLFYKSISLIWNYSPVVSSGGTLDVKN